MISQVKRVKKEQKKVEHKVNEWGIEVVTAGDKDESKKMETVKVE